MPETIRFISQEEFDWMSNFYVSPFRFEGRMWKTVEHAFQAAKVNFTGEYAKLIQKAIHAGQAKRLGQRVPLRGDWETVKVDIMRKLVQEKLKAHPRLQDKLLATGSARIEEDSHWDRFWGTGRTGAGGNGKNMMGRILMDLRESLRQYRSKEK